MRKLIIEKAAVRANMAVIKERARGAALYGVLTGDGGGAGLTELARLIRDEGISRFAVGTVEEAQALREAGFEDEELLMLRATVDREELERLVDLNVVCTISSVDTGLALNAVAENRSTVAEAHIQVDTGMGFGGFLIGEPEKILWPTARCPTWPFPASTPSSTPCPPRARRWAHSSGSSARCWTPSMPPALRRAPSTPPAPMP